MACIACPGERSAFSGLWFGPGHICSSPEAVGAIDLVGGKDATQGIIYHAQAVKRRMQH
jgi:hypothetical protein